MWVVVSVAWGCAQAAAAVSMPSGPRTLSAATTSAIATTARLAMEAISARRGSRRTTVQVTAAAAQLTTISTSRGMEFCGPGYPTSRASHTPRCQTTGGIGTMQSAPDPYVTPVLAAREQGPARRFAGRMDGRHPVLVFFAAVLSGMAAL